MSDFGAANLDQLVRQFRTAAGLSQEALAERSGVSARAISDMERGLRQSARLSTIRLLADGLELDQHQRLALFSAARRPKWGDIAASSNDPVSMTRDKGLFPVPATPLIGRQQELSKIIALVLEPDARLVSLTGAGGSGKTRLAIEAAQILCRRPSIQKSAFVDLSVINDVDAVIPMIFRSLNIKALAQKSWIQVIRASVDGSGQTLLVLDNFEHVIGAAPEIAEMLSHTSALRLLVTSRKPLHISWEREFVVPPMEVPEHHEPLAEVAASESVQLFLDRSRAAGARINEDEQELREIAEICRRIDGLPLAIQLAAARTKVVPVHEMALRMERRLELLSDGGRDLPGRQHTMRSTISWSYELLAIEDRRLLCWLAVFMGGFSLDAAEAIHLEANGSRDVLGSLTSLVDIGFIRVGQDANGSARYFVFETVREFGLDELRRNRELRRALDAHARYFVEFVYRDPVTPSVVHQTRWLYRIDPEDGNLIAAFDHLCNLQPTQECLRFAFACGYFWKIRLLDEEVLSRLERVLSMTENDDSSLRAMVLIHAASGALNLGHIQQAEWHAGNALRIARKTGDRFVDGNANQILAGAFARRSDDCSALRHYMRSQAIGHDLGERELEAVAKYGLAQVAFRRGEMRDALKLTDEAMGLLQDKGFEAMALSLLGTIAVEEGSISDAIRLLDSSFSGLIETRDMRLLVKPMIGFAWLSCEVREYELGARWIGVVEGHQARFGIELDPTESTLVERSIKSIVEAIGPERYEQATARGHKLPLEEWADLEAELLVSAGIE